MLSSALHPLNCLKTMSNNKWKQQMSALPPQWKHQKVMQIRTGNLPQRCKICKGAFGSVKDLNDHHRENHGVVDCDLCYKKFETHTALDKHKYSHKNLNFVCEDCGQSFAFKSRLDQHRIVHQDVLNYIANTKDALTDSKTRVT